MDTTLDRTDGATPSRITGASLAAVCTIAAAAIHFSVAGAEYSEAWQTGVGILAMAWAQLILGIMVLRGRGGFIAGALALVNAVAIGAWAVSRSAGLPYGPDKGVALNAGFIDMTAVALETAAIILAAASGLLSRWLVRGMALTALVVAVFVVVPVASVAILDGLSAESSETAEGGESGDEHSQGGESSDQPNEGGSAGESGDSGESGETH